MGFIENRDMLNDEGEDRFKQVLYHPGNVETLNGEMSVSHGYSYLYARRQMRELGDLMGFDIMNLHPNTEYSRLVEISKEMDEIFGGLDNE